MIYYDQSILFVHQNLLPNTMDINGLLEVSLLLKCSLARGSARVWCCMNGLKWTRPLWWERAIQSMSLLGLTSNESSQRQYSIKRRRNPQMILARTWNRYGISRSMSLSENILFCIVGSLSRKKSGVSTFSRVVLQEPPHIKRLLPSSPKASLSELVEQGLLVGRLCLENSQISPSLLEMRRSKKQTWSTKCIVFCAIYFVMEKLQPIL